jgi:hypothetical protein
MKTWAWRHGHTDMDTELKYWGIPHCSKYSATKRVLFSDPLVSSPSSSRAPPQDGPRTVFLPGEEVFARPGPAAPSQVPQTRYPSRQRAPPQRPLSSSPPSRGQSSGGALWTPGYTPTDHLTSWGVLYHPCTVPVYKLLFISQKPVLSYLLSRLLPHVLQKRNQTEN